ncbi:MAG: carboxypeptidase-like regulatory domain-containing protein [Chitinophagaceae bacterium]
MNNNNNDKILYSAADIQRYLDGQMSVGEMNAMERTAMEDPFLADAIEGYSNKVGRGEAGTTGDLDELRALLKKRIEATHKKIIPFYRTQWWKIAAMFLLLAGSGTVIYYFTINSVTDKTVIAKNNTKEQKAMAMDSSPVVASGVVDSTLIARNEVENRQADAVPERAQVPLKKSVNPVTSLKPASPVVTMAPQEKKSGNISAQKDSNDLSSSSERERSGDILNKEVMASRKQQAYYKSKPVSVFSGKVVNQNDQPVSNAAISLPLNKMDTAYVTDSNGYFQFTLPDTMASVVISSVGFETAKMNLQGNRTSNEIRLKAANQSLNEVVVVGYGADKKRSVKTEETSTEFQEAVPVNGLDSFNHYIESNKKIQAQQNNQHGKVVVSFLVSKKGELSNFKIVKSLSSWIDEEAIRLIKEGPPWKVLKNKKTKALITVNF